MSNLLSGIMARFGYIPSKAGDWMDGKPKPGSGNSNLVQASTYDPDQEFEALSKATIKNPITVCEADVKAGKVKIREAYLFEARIGPNGKPLIEKDAIEKIRQSLTESERGAFPEAPYRIRRVEGGEAFTTHLTESATLIQKHPTTAREARRRKYKAIEKLREHGGFDSFDFDADFSNIGQYDRNQYTEYAPIYGGPYFKQLYLYDYLTQHARSFEAWNHNPVAKRIVKILQQYAMGRGFKAVSKRHDNDKLQQAWDQFAKDHNIIRKITRFWPCEYIIYGELMVDKTTWQSVDPSTIWDIITDPDNLEKVYYYHQQYPTAYYQFTGIKVPGVPGSEKTAPIEYIIRQLPYDQIIHIKSQCVSNEKRGRSWLFPILGWLKRVKDIYNADVIRHWLQASFIWDDTIQGSQADIDAHVAKYSQMPNPGSVFAHNEAITRQPMPVASNRMGGTDNVAQEVLAFIATCLGIPKEHFNLTSAASSRATALVASEPFTKVIEEVQGDMEYLLMDMARVAMPQYGISDYKDGDLEFVFPSVTKDTTTETVTNVMAGETSGYLSKKTAAQMYSTEMNITTYDYDAEQAEIEQEMESGRNLNKTGQEIPGGRSPMSPPPDSDIMKDAMKPDPNDEGAPPAPPEEDPEELRKDKSPIRGTGKEDLKKDLNRV